MAMSERKETADTLDDLADWLQDKGHIVKAEDLRHAAVVLREAAREATPPDPFKGCDPRDAAPAPPAGETHLHGNTYCYEGDECVICREQKRQATSDSPEAATRYGSDSFQPSAPNGGGSGQYLTPAQAVVIMVCDEMKHAENYVCPDSGVVRFCIPLAHLNILLKAVEGE